MSEREPDLDGPVVESPIAEHPEIGEGVVIVPSPSAPDELAYTGPFDVIAAGLGALVLVYAGFALLGRKATDSGILASLDAHRLRRAALRPEQGGAA